jgi:hypothetical protein
MNVTDVATGGKLTYEDILEAQEKIGDKLQPKKVVVYHPDIIEDAIDEGYIRVDKFGRMWTVSHNFPWLNGIEIFPSKDVDKDLGFIIDEGGVSF